MGNATVNATAPAKPAAAAKPAGDPLQTDKRYKLLEATMRKHGYQGHALIEALHTAQEAFGYLDDLTLKHIARSLHLPPSKVYGVATFYNYFTLKPQGKHTCVVCLGTACYIKGANDSVAAIQQEYKVKPGGTSPDGELSLLIARCVGSCGTAPVAVIDGEVAPKVTPQGVLARLAKVVGK